MKNKELKLCPFCLSNAIPVFTQDNGDFTHVTCGNHKCEFGTVLTINDWNHRLIRKTLSNSMDLPLSKDDYRPERTDIRDRRGFTVAKDVLQVDADFIIKCCNSYDQVRE